MTKSITVAGHIFEVAQPYAAGTHDLSEGEAAALNQVRAENIRNNMASRVKAAMKDAPEGTPLPAELVEEFAAYERDYAFAIRQPGQVRETDPIAVEARKIARATLAAAIKAAGKSRKDYTDEQFENLLSAVAAKDEVQKAAVKAVRERSKLAEGALEGMEL